ncbi:MAG: hypothetical protein A2Y07_00020 [Planctomycetes bacterium GWF2_50_10]|nr:MAG: hypothetical protein A2Y07_00020 [Planctomycetes bacterium GWF2_50_10]
MIRFVPNILTFIRLALSLVFLAMVLYYPAFESAEPAKSARYLDWSFVLFIIAALTDIIDGKIARKYNASSKLGRMLDPLVDKVLICGAFICFAIIGQPRLFNLSGYPLLAIQWGVAGIITAREVVMTIIRQIAESRGINFAAKPAGKLKMFVQSFAVGTIIVKMAHFPEAAWANWFTFVILVFAAIITISSAISATRRK